MAKYFTNFADDIIGQMPPDWTSRWVNWEEAKVAEPEGAGWATGGKVFRLVPSAGHDWKLVTWDVVNDDAGRADAEVYFRARVYGGTASARSAQTGFRALGDAAEGTMYRLSGLSGLYRQIGKRVAGTWTVLASESFSHSEGAIIHSLTRVNGGNLMVKSWLDNDPEHEDWQLTTTDSDITDAGWIGLADYSSSGSARWEVDMIGVGTGGDTAPRSAALPFEGNTQVGFGFGDWTPRPLS